MMMQKKVWVLVGGLPGSGKTYLGSEISRNIGLFLDKDTVTRSFSEALLESLQQPVNDRESPTYLAQVRPKEYETMKKSPWKILNWGIPWCVWHRFWLNFLILNGALIWNLKLKLQAQKYIMCGLILTKTVSMNGSNNAELRVIIGN